jgi:hypothetical protein
MRLEGVAVDHVDRPVEQPGDVLLDIHVLVDRPFGSGLEFDQDVDVAVRPILAARDRAEHGCAADAARPQSGLGFLQSGDDIVAAHCLNISLGVLSFQVALVLLWGRIPADVRPSRGGKAA